MKQIKKITALLSALILAAALFGCKTAELQSDKLPENPPKAPASAQTAEAAVQTEALAVYSEEEIIRSITELVARQEAAIITADTGLMEQTINPADSWLKLEAAHLVADQKVWPVSGYKRTITDIAKEGAYYTGTVAQSFVFQGQEKESCEQRYFMFEDGQAYDMGTVLEKAKAGIVFISFPEGHYDFAKDLGDVTSEYVAAVNEMWGMSFRDPISIKIYGDKKVFLYNIKLSMPDWAGGWYERGESIKTYLYDTTQDYYEYLARHEATHMMLSAVTCDNASYWMQEGFATTMPVYVTTGALEINRIDTLREAYGSGRLPTFQEHVETNIESLSEIFDVRLYYGYSSAMVIYLLEQTTDDTLKKLFNELNTYPYISLTLSEKARDTQVITEKCFKKATGKTFAQFYAGFDEWLKLKLS